MENGALLQVNHLSVSFEQYTRGLKKRTLSVIEDLNLTVKAGEMTAVVGASGSGKSLLAHGILGLLPYNASMSGQIFYEGCELTEKRRKQAVGKEIVLVPQSVSYLDPLMKVGEQVRNGDRSLEAERRCSSLLSRYGLEKETENKYPFELSGGMTRRVLISSALMEQPKLIIADEPTPGLHLSAAKRVLGHFRELADQGAGVLLITHDLELALEVADRIAVFYAGTTVEEMPAAYFQEEKKLAHPYSRALYRAMPANGFKVLSGTQPYVTERGTGCVFASRCPGADAECQKTSIPIRKTEDGWVRCRKGNDVEA
ncbi:MAG: ABC transporter ATP-binding protein [Lachnospiraceae bacterium]